MSMYKKLLNLVLLLEEKAAEPSKGAEERNIFQGLFNYSDVRQAFVAIEAGNSVNLNVNEGDQNFGIWWTKGWFENLIRLNLKCKFRLKQSKNISVSV